jgi:Protein of unknown function (DUF1236)
MNVKILAAGVLLTALALPVSAYAQTNGGVATGAVAGAVGGAVVGGPVGAVVGGVGGAVVGGIASQQSPGFNEYVTTQHRRSYRYSDQVVVGAVLPSDGPDYYAVPSKYGAKQYRYSVVNGQTVLVDPRTHRIVQVIN